jgi:hypothetical protein
MQMVCLNGRRCAALFLLTTLVLGGCTDTSGPVDPFTRVPISGTVTLDGAPLSVGTIQFDPAGDTKGPQSSGEINAGKFTIDKVQGPVAGKYKVSISGKTPAKISADEQPGGTPKVVPDPVPAKFNTKTTLEVDVPAGGSSSLEFPLKK